MKKGKSALALVAVAAVLASSLVGCKSPSTTSSTTPASSSTPAPAAEGKVLNIWVWNNEFQSRFNDFFPEVKEVAKDLSTTTLKDGTTVKWTINANQGSNYQNKLDAALMSQESTEADKKIDIFLFEADYALKYVNSDFTLDVKKDIGLTDSDLANQYKYTQDITTSKSGALKGVSWQATPGLYVYRRSIAQSVLGTDDPDKVQEQLSTWDKFNSVAATMKGKGYKMLSGYDDSYRVFSNNVSAGWVNGTTVTVDPSIMKWVTQTKDFTDKGYNNKTTLWADGWTKDQQPGSKVFGVFYSTWGINFTLEGNSLAKSVSEGGSEVKGNGIFGDWAVCPGPQNWYWGGTWIAGCKGTDNKTLVKAVMKDLTCDQTIMTNITKKTQDYTNNKAAMDALASSDFKSDFLGGQNHIKLFAAAAPKIDMSKAGPYDQGCNEAFQTAFHDYFNGTVTLDKAKTNFTTAVKQKYPELTDVKWPA